MNNTPQTTRSQLEGVEARPREWPMGGTLNRSRAAVAHERRQAVKAKLERICQELWDLPTIDLEAADRHSVIEATERIRLVVEGMES